MKKALKIIIPIICLIIFFTLLIIIKKLDQKLSVIPLNNPTEQGNTAGNLYNHGYFAEKEGKIYFANAYDNNRLYSMNPDQSDIKLLANGNISHINVLGNYIYYYSSTTGDQAGLGYVRAGRGFYRTHIGDGETFSMEKTTSDSMIGIGNHLYFTSFNDSDTNGNAEISVNTVTTSNEELATVLNEHIVLGGYYDGKIYYGGVTGDHFIHTFDTYTNTSSVFSEESVYLPMVYDGEIYYLDLEDNYHLKAMSLSDGNIRTVVNERIDTYNMYNGIIYYQNVDPDNYALKRVYVNGGEPETVANGVYKDINITGTYTYFREFGNDIPVYQQSTNGSINVTTFDRAKDAAIAEIK